MAKSLKSAAKAKENDLFGSPEPKGKAQLKVAVRSGGAEAAYTARDIEVLEGLEPVRRRPGMYIGGTDEKALHHLFAEVIDNSMDEALAGHATFIEVELSADGFLAVTDNGRGIPVDPHPKFPKKSALEVIMCTLHSGGKFDSKVYETSGGLHGVGVSVVNALSSRLEVEVARSQKLYRMSFERGHPKGKLEDLGKINNRRGTRIRFKPDSEIFGAKAAFNPHRLFKMTRSKAYLFGGVEIRWRCDPELLKGIEDIPAEDSFHFPGGLKDYLAAAIHADTLVHPDIFSGKSGRNGAHGACEWAVAWTADADGFLSSYCNTVPTPDGGTHESGMRSAMLRGLKDHAERIGQGKRAAPITSEDVMVGAAVMLSVFVREPEFQGQTKDRLATAEAQRIVEQAIKDPFDHWLSGNRLRHAGAIPRRRSALFPHHHHDRRRRRRRAYRIALDHVLLPADAAADRRGPSLSGRAAALSPDPWRQDGLRPRRSPQGHALEERVQRQRQGRCRPLQRLGRDDAGAAQGNHHGPGQAHAAPRGAYGRRPRRHRRFGRAADGNQGRGPVRLHLRQGGIRQRRPAGRVTSRLLALSGL